MNIFNLEELFRGKAHKDQFLRGLIDQNRFDSFEDAVCDLIEEQLDYIKISKEKLNELYPIVHPVENEEEFSTLTEEQLKVYDEITSLESDIYFTKEQLLSIQEMHIVYLFKNVEIAIKKLIIESYGAVDTSKLYQFENMISFFKNKGIQVHTLDGYNEVNQLKNVNNAIKHNGEIGSSIDTISEFVGEEGFSFVNLNAFYARIKMRVNLFLHKLIDEILKDLYVFSEDRISVIAQEYKDRMDEATIEKLTIKLNEK